MIVRPGDVLAAYTNDRGSLVIRRKPSLEFAVEESEMYYSGTYRIIEVKEKK